MLESEGDKENIYMKLFGKKEHVEKRKAEAKNKIFVKCGENDFRSYPATGSLLNINLMRENDHQEIEGKDRKK